MNAGSQNFNQKQIHKCLKNCCGSVVHENVLWSVNIITTQYKHITLTTKSDN